MQRFGIWEKDQGYHEGRTFGCTVGLRIRFFEFWKRINGMMRRKFWMHNWIANQFGRFMDGTCFDSLLIARCRSIDCFYLYLD